MSVPAQTPRLPSNTRFGLLFALIFATGSGYLFWKGKYPGASILVLVAVALVGIVLTRSSLLTPLNRMWFAFGLLLGRIVSPVVLGVLFFAIVTPVALFGKLFGRDPLRLRKRKEATSHWIQRDPVGPAADSFKHQF
jgi:hypothetical protein